jgi:hypothetical protein
VLRVAYPSAKAWLIHMDTKVNVVSICRGFFLEGEGARKTLSAYIYILAIHFPVPPR